MTDEEESSGGVVKWVLGGIAAVLTLIIGFVCIAVVGIAAVAGTNESDSRDTSCLPDSSTPGSATPAGTNTAAGAPDSLKVPVGDSGSLTLDKAQLAIASAIISGGSQRGVPSKGLKVALMVAFQESKLQMLANSTVPESLDYDHDGVGSDHDSLNPFQQRVSSGWGTVAELMDLDYAIAAFFGGPDGPNDGSPRGLLDIAGWEDMAPGVAAQTVQVSRFPDAYNQWEAASEKVISVLGEGGTCTTGTIDGEMALPLGSDYNMTSGYGPREVTVAGASSWHAAIDLQRWPNPCGDPVNAILPGTVTLSSPLWLSIEHPDGFVVSYLHMYKSERLVDVGDEVTAGQQIGVTGNAPPSGGCHLDLRINVASNTNPEVDKLVRSQDETRFTPAPEAYNHNFVDPEEFMALWGVEVCPAKTCTRPN